MKDTKYTFEWLEAVNLMSNEKRIEFLSVLIDALQLTKGIEQTDEVLKCMVDKLI